MRGASGNLAAHHIASLPGRDQHKVWHGTVPRNWLRAPAQVGANLRFEGTVGNGFVHLGIAKQASVMLSMSLQGPYERGPCLLAFLSFPLICISIIVECMWLMGRPGPVDSADCPDSWDGVAWIDQYLAYPAYFCDLRLERY